MADAELGQETDESSKKGSGRAGANKAPLKMAGALVAVLSLGAVAAFMAIPGKETKPHFGGPFSFNIISKDEKISANTLDNNQSRYLQLGLHCEYFAYDETYLSLRVTDPLYKPTLLSEVNALISTKRLSQAMVGESREAFVAELQELLDPILFPVHFGQTALPNDLEEKSGIRPGDSYRHATFRGRFYDHVLKVDAIEKTLQLNEETAVTFEGNEEDYKLVTQGGEALFLDLTELKPDFQGELHVGIRGRIRRLNLPDFIAQ